MKEPKEADSEVHTTVKHARTDLLLVPQPSEDPTDPLDWSMSRKILILGIVSLSAFIGVAQALTNQSGFFVQAEVYHKSPLQLTYLVG